MRSSRNTHRQRGVALLLVLIAVAMAAVIAVTFSREQATSTGIADNSRNHARARTIAESALRLAVKHVQENNDWREAFVAGDWVVDQAFDGGSFTLTGEDGQDTDGDGVVDGDGDLADDVTDALTLTANATFNGVNHRVRAVVQPAVNGGSVLETGKVTATAVSTTVALSGSYNEPVVVCTVHSANNTNPVVARVANVSSASFDVYLQNPSGDTVVADDVSYLVMEAGAWTIDGIKCEAQRYTSTVTDRKGSWRAEQQTYLQDYEYPVVIGQVMSANDPDWSVFWAHGSSATNAPDDDDLYTGKHVGEDTDYSRADEVIGFIVFETGHGEVNDVALDATLSMDFVQGYTNSPPDDVDFEEAFDEPPAVVLVSAAGMDGGDGGWPITYGDPFASAEYAYVCMDEDQVRDNDRSHTTEQVAVVAFASTFFGSDTPAPRLLALYEFNEVSPPLPQAIGHWQLDETLGGGGLSVGEKVELKNDARIDSFNSQAGAYGGANILDTAVVTTNSTSADQVKLTSDSIINGDVYVGAGGDPDTVIDNDGTITGYIGILGDNVSLAYNSSPGGMPASEGNTDITSTQTWTTDRHFGKLKVKSSAVLTIDGNITVYCEGEFKVENSGRIVLTAGSSLDLYVAGKIEIKNDAQLNYDTTRSADVRIYHLPTSGNDMKVKNDAVVCADIYSNNNIILENESQTWGRILAYDKVTIKNDAQLHLDVAMPSAGSALPPATDAVAEVDGIYRNGPALGEAGQQGTAVAFDGDDDYIEIPHDDSYLLDSGTVAMWIKPAQTSSRMDFFSKDSTGYDTGGHLTMHVQNNTIKVRLQSSTDSHWVEGGSIAADQWYHVAFSWGALGMRLFVNGTQVDTDTYTGGLGETSGDAGNFEPIVLGANAWESDDLSAAPLEDYFEGVIDDVRIFDQPFNAAQVANVMAGSDPGAGDLKGWLVEDTADYLEPLDLGVEDSTAITWIDGGGLRFDTDGRAVSAGAATKIYDALAESNELSLEIIFTPDNTSQAGPARILGLSTASGDRAFSFGQASQAYALRLHTSDSFSDGSPSIESEDVLVADTQEHIIVTFDGYVVNMYRNGSLEVAEERTGDFSTWSSLCSLVIGNEVGEDWPWRGTLHRVALYDRAFNAGQAGNVFNGESPGDGVSDVAFTWRWVEMR